MSIYYVTADMLYGAIMRYCRKAVLMTQLEASIYYGFSIRYYSRYERGLLPIPTLYLEMAAELGKHTPTEHLHHLDNIYALLRTQSISITHGICTTGSCLLPPRELNLIVSLAARAMYVQTLAKSKTQKQTGV